MYQAPVTGQKVFEVSLHNRQVRALVKEKHSHETFQDHWADVQIRDVVANSEDDARLVIEKRYPAEDGFVIDDILPTRF